MVPKMLLSIDGKNAEEISRIGNAYYFRGYEIYFAGLKQILETIAETDYCEFNIPNLAVYSTKKHSVTFILELFSNVTAVIRQKDLDSDSPFNEFPDFCALISNANIEWNKLKPYGNVLVYVAKLDFYAFAAKYFKHRNLCPPEIQIRYKSIWETSSKLLIEDIIKWTDEILVESSIKSEYEKSKISMSICVQFKNLMLLDTIWKE